MIAAEWQILFHSFQGKDIDIQILDGYTEQMPLLARSTREAGIMPQFWGWCVRLNQKETHVGEAWRAALRARASQTHALSSQLSKHICLDFHPSSRLESLPVFLNPVWTHMGTVDWNLIKTWVCAAPKPRGEDLLHPGSQEPRWPRVKETAFLSASWDIKWLNTK